MYSLMLNGCNTTNILRQLEEYYLNTLMVLLQFANMILNVFFCSWGHKEKLLWAQWYQKLKVSLCDEYLVHIVMAKMRGVDDRDADCQCNWTAKDGLAERPADETQ